MLDRPNVPEMTPCHLPRSAGGKMSAIKAKVLVMRMPPAIPCNPRNSTSWIIDWDAPQSADAIMKKIMPPMKKYLRP